MRTILITGASGGLGTALAHQFMSGGDRVILVARDYRKLLRVVEKRFDAKWVLVDGDLRADSTRAVLERTIEMMDGVDVLINNAAVYWFGAFEEMPEDNISTILETNLVSHILLTRSIYAIMTRQRRGLIINIGSAAAKCGGFGESVYAASKAGLAGFSRTLRPEAKKHGIGILDVTLGAMNTGMLAHRSDREQCIDPEEVAAEVYALTLSRTSMVADEIVLSRSR